MPAEFLTPQGRPIIVPNVDGPPILGGAYLARGTVVVDYRENPKPFERMFERADHFLGEGRTDVSAREVADTVNYVVLDAVKFNKQGTRVAMREAVGRDKVELYDEIPLSGLIEAGVGVCYHQALASAAIISLLQKRRGIGGTVSIDQRAPILGSHAWTRYSKDKDKVVIDSAEFHVVKLDGSLNPRDRQYLRSGETAAD